MTPHEVLFLIGKGGAVLWCDESDNPALLPDSRARWQAIWRLRDELEEIAHSHPGGPRAFSREDETTMLALTSALGRALRFSVIAPDGMIMRDGGKDSPVDEEPWWAPLLRAASGMKPKPTSAGQNQDHNPKEE
jgi:hypothetical protein